MGGWVTKARVDAGERLGASSSEREEIRRLKRENAELCRANEILKATAGDTQELDLPRCKEAPRRCCLTVN